MRRSLFILKGRLNNILLPVDQADNFLDGEPVEECSFSKNSIISWGILYALLIKIFIIIDRFFSFIGGKMV